MTYYMFPINKVWQGLAEARPGQAGPGQDRSDRSWPGMARLRLWLSLAIPYRIDKDLARVEAKGRDEAKSSTRRDRPVEPSTGSPQPSTRPTGLVLV